MNAIRIFAGASLLALTHFALAANVTVAFVQPENYTDAGYSHRIATPGELADVQREIVRHLERLSERTLAPDESLRIEILDIDLAGQFEPFTFRNGGEVRIVRDVTAPHIHLRYILSRGDQALASGEERLTDLDFLLSSQRYLSNDKLRYEKPMLDRWFEKRFGKPRVEGGRLLPSPS